MSPIEVLGRVVRNDGDRRGSDFRVGVGVVHEWPVRTPEQFRTPELLEFGSLDGCIRCVDV